jgi:4-amino-4-deoxy-L-arabinose transferase-like glycosyltransferase
MRATDPVVDRPARPLPAFAARHVGAVAGVTALVLIAFSGRYGYHRDELYFIQCGRHLAWGYPDQPPLVPFIARVMTAIAPSSLVVLRLPSALAVAGSIVLTGLIVRELGGSRPAQILGAGALAISNFVVATGHLLSTTTFGLPVWAGISLLSLRAVRTGNNRLWVAVGLVAGIGLLDNDLVAFFMAALFVSVLIVGPRRIFASPWLYVGAVLMVAVWSPYLIWQGQHGWPQLTIARDIANGGSGTSAPRALFLPFQVLLPGIFVTPIWITGLVQLARNPAYRWCRAVSVTWVVLAVVFIATGGKPYYIDGMLPVLFAAGAPRVWEWCNSSSRRLRWIPLVTVLSLVGVIITLPVLPAGALHDSPVVALNYDAGETVAWPTFVAEIGAVYQRVAARHPGHTTILTSNYGEAGAVDRYGAQHDLPSAYAVQNAFWLWGPPPASVTDVVAVGFDRDQLTPVFGSVRLARRLDNHVSLDNDEQGEAVWVCHDLKGSWATEWRGLRDYG